jgi:spore germination cell wall hydrolase CwlJ-like protein
VNRSILLLSGIAVLLLFKLSFTIGDISTQTEQIEQRLNRLEGIVDTGHRVNHTVKDVECLARNIYYEAGNQADIGRYAVAHVTVNRVRSGYWGTTVCGVVHAPSQFSWTLLKRLPQPDPGIYHRCQEIAQAVLAGEGVAGLERSLFYHADYIQNPNWADVTQRAKKIGQHIFYNRAKGSTLEI